MLNQKGVNPTSFDYQISLEQYSNFYASNSLKLTQKQFSFIGLIIFIVKIILCYESQHLYSIFSVTCFLSFGQESFDYRSLPKKMCSPELHGRGYVNQGDLIAAKFISSQMKELGIESLPSGIFKPLPIM